MSDISWVTGRLAIGGAIESLYDARQIANSGVTHVLNLRMGDKNPEHTTDEIPWLQKVGIAYVNNGAHDDGESKPVEWFAASIDYAMSVLSKPGNRLMIHCKEGINRSPSTAYAILRAWGTSAEDSLEHVMDARPEAEVGYQKDADRAVKALGWV